MRGLRLEIEIGRDTEAAAPCRRVRRQLAAGSCAPLARTTRKFSFNRCSRPTCQAYWVSCWSSGSALRLGKANRKLRRARSGRAWSRAVVLLLLHARPEGEIGRRQAGPSSPGNSRRCRSLRQVVAVVGRIVQVEAPIRAIGRVVEVDAGDQLARHRRRDCAGWSGAASARTPSSVALKPLSKSGRNGLKNAACWFFCRTPPSMINSVPGTTCG